MIRLPWRRWARLRIITWNCEVGRPGRAVRHAILRLIRRHQPDVIVLQEARPYRDDLADVPGYTLYEPRGKSMEAGNCITLVRTFTATSVTKRALRMDIQWEGPKAGKAHPGRVFLETVVNDWCIVNVHRTRPSWSKGGAAFAEEYDALRESAREAEARGQNWLAIGDQNIGTRKTGDRNLPNGPWRLAENIGGRCITVSPGRIDYPVVGPGIKGKGRQLGDYGSDHNAVLYKLKARRGRRRPAGAS